MTSRKILLMLLCAIALSACSRSKKHPVLVNVPPAPSSRPSPPPNLHPGDRETGVASWYGIPFHGRQAANGEIYDMDKMTAAHRTLPFGTIVNVRNLSNGRETQVRIIDRGPFVNGRIIDLSRAAASELGIIGPGTAQVTLEIVAPPRVPESEMYAVQIGAFADRARAEALRDSMESRYGSAELVLRQANVTLWRVLVGRVNSEEKAQELARTIRAEGRAALVVRLDPDSRNFSEEKSAAPRTSVQTN